MRKAEEVRAQGNRSDPVETWPYMTYRPMSLTGTSFRDCGVIGGHIYGNQADLRIRAL